MTDNNQVKALISFENINEKTLKRLGFCLGQLLCAGDVILLRGEMGAGKSVLTRAAAAGLGVEGPVPSPTFTILNIHEGTQLRLYHFDLYRLESADALWEMGLEEYIPSADGATFIEWPQMAEEAMPQDVLEIEIVYAQEGMARSVFMTTMGDFDAARLDGLKEKMEACCEYSDD